MVMSKGQFRLLLGAAHQLVEFPGVASRQRRTTPGSKDAAARLAGLEGFPASTLST
jgi:hypothetical protein